MISHVPSYVGLIDVASLISCLFYRLVVRMVSGLGNFKIPRRQEPAPSVPQPSPLDRVGQDTSVQPLYCIHCRTEHLATSYCSRMGRKKKQVKADSDDEESGHEDVGDEDSESSEESSDDSSGDSSGSDSSEDTESGGEKKADAHGPPSSSTALARFCG